MVCNNKVVHNAVSAVKVTTTPVQEKPVQEEGEPVQKKVRKQKS